MAVSWKYKCALQTAMSALPNPEVLNLWFQKNITHGLPPGDDRVLEKVAWARHHVGEYCRYGRRPLQDSRFFEFGAGWDFAGTLAHRALDVAQQLVVDIRHLGQADIAEATIDTLIRVMPEFEAVRALRSGATSIEGLLGNYGIEYRARRRDAATHLDAGSIDCITSTDTLEHIPRADIAAILAECHRILADDGVMSFRIDYRDHWAYFDTTITPVNMLRYDARQWSRRNPSLNFQNRLRHDDYADMFDAAGFRALAIVQEQPVAEAYDFVDHHQLAAEFSHYSREALVIPSATFTLSKA